MFTEKNILRSIKKMKFTLYADDRISIQYSAGYSLITDAISAYVMHNKLLNPLSAKPTKWSNTLTHIAGFCRQII